MFHLEKLNYYYQVYIDEDNLEEFPKKLKNCAGKSLAISCEVMGAKNIQQMSTALKQFPQFMQFKIYCSFKQLKDAGLIELMKGIQVMMNLTVLRLHLCNNSISDKGLNELSKSLRQLDFLQHLELNLSQNKIEGCTSFRNVAQSLEGKRSLVEFNLDVSSNQLSKKTNIRSLWSTLSQDSIQIININCSQNKACDNLFQQLIYLFSVINGLPKYSIDLDLSKKQRMNRKQTLELREQLTTNLIKCQQFKLNLDLIDFKDYISFIGLVRQFIENRFNSVQYQIILSDDQTNRQQQQQQTINILRQFLKQFQAEIHTIIAYQHLVSNHLTFCSYQHLCDLFY